METKIQIKSIFGKLLFEFECENNSIKKTLENAIISGAKLSSADLIGADLIGADLRNANLRYANLSNANLIDADLRCSYFINANLENADLSGADIRNADLRYTGLIGTNFSGAYLRNADLRGAYLRNANLIGADLRGADFENADISGAKNKEMAYLPMHCKWSHSIIGDKIQIGCEEKTIEEWENFFNSDEIFSTERNTSEFKQIQAVFEAYKGYLNFLNK